MLDRKKNKGILKLGQNRCGGVVISQKQGPFLLLFIFCCGIYYLWLEPVTIILIMLKYFSVSFCNLSLSFCVILVINF